MVTGLALGLALMNTEFTAGYSPKPTPLESYLQLPQRNLPETKVTKKDNLFEIEFSSQRWQNTIWTHRILLLVPKNAEKSKTALLYITGDGPRKGDFVDLNLLAAATGMPIAMLFNIPNQPIWGMKEDDLIAHTFEKFLETKDETWPLLFPMTKAAVSSLDVVAKVAKDNKLAFNKFLVTGASKRGWTTWLTAASRDRRIAGIAPMVYDNLNIGPQMKHQISSWGAYSEQIEDYTRRGLQAKLETPDGQRLLAMIDPYSYRDSIRVPTLIVNGANDPYWTVDATKQYWSDLKQPKYLLEVPNAGHGLEDRARVVSTIGAFARSLDGRFKMPNVKAKLTATEEATSGIYSIDAPGAVSLSIWKNESDTRDFRTTKWRETKVTGNSVVLELTPGKYTASFVEARYSPDGKSFTLSTPVEVIEPKKK